MLWNRFHKDREFLDLYENPNFPPETGVIDKDEASKAVAKIQGRSPDIIKAKACAFVLEHCAIDVNPKCWFGVNVAGRVPSLKYGANNTINQLIGKFFSDQTKGNPIEKTLTAMSESYAGAGAHFPDHVHYVPDWDAVLHLGYPGLLKRARDYRNKHDTLTNEQIDFYDSVEIMLTACIRFISRLADLAEERIQEDPRMPLRVKCLRSLESGAPKDIYEAMQLMHIHQFLGQFVECAQVRSLGDIDRLLYPYFLKDLYRGAYTREQVKELFQYFFIIARNDKIVSVSNIIHFRVVSCAIV